MENFKENIGGTHTLRVKEKKADGLYPRGRTVSILCYVEELELLDLSQNHISNVPMRLKFPETEVRKLKFCVKFGSLIYKEL